MKLMTSTEISRLIQVPEWRIRRLFETGRLPEPGRIGTTRAIPASMLPRIKEALQQRGWLPSGDEASTIESAMGRVGNAAA